LRALRCHHGDVADDPGLELVEVTIERVIGFRESSAAAVVLSHPTKKFLIFVGPAEGAAVQRELAHQKADRPATHDLLDYVLKGFEIEVKKVVVSAIMNNVFCATVILTQKAHDGGPSEEVRLDARASDSIVVALKAKVPLWVTKRVLDAVDDAGPHLAAADEKPEEDSDSEAGMEEESDDKPDFEFDPGEEDEGDDDDDDKPGS
jgi:bifunctional DNase/RNase